jgi:hypothetical protein
MKLPANYPAVASPYLAAAFLVGCIPFCLGPNEVYWYVLACVGLLALAASLGGLALARRQPELPGARSAPWGFGLTLAGVLIFLMGAGAQDNQNRATRTTLNGKLKHLALAMHGYQDVYHHFPPPASCDKEGRPLLSWRVHLLPYVEQDDLYKQFKLDEPWDSPHNLPLLEKMPAPYALPDGFQNPAEPHATFFQVFVGPGAAFEKCKGMSIKEDFPDGPGNTLLIVTAAEAVPWTKPADLVYAPGRPLPPPGVRLRYGTPQLPTSVPLVGLVFADGITECLSLRDIREEALRAWITRNGNEPLGPR